MSPRPTASAWTSSNLTPGTYTRDVFLTEHGGEPYAVVLRFDSYQARWIRERTWHPSQELALTRDGCEWTAIIGETLEIEPWIRGWGGDCEVLEPAALRERMLTHVRRMVETYQLAPSRPRNPEEFDDTLFRAKE